MAKQTILWTVLPWGRVPEGDLKGKWRVSVVVSPRLVPEAADEQALEAFPDFLNWPATLARAGFRLRIGARQSALTLLSRPDPDLWKSLFSETTPVAGFVYKDMSAINLHSFPLRTVLRTLRTHYRRMASDAGEDHPKLLPWDQADPEMKDLLGDLGTRTRRIDFGNISVETMLPGFDRFFDGRVDGFLKEAVFGQGKIYETDIPSPRAEEQALPGTMGKAPRRALSPDWYDPRPGGPGTPLVGGADAGLMDLFATEAEYALYQSDRFYRRERPTHAQKLMTRPTFKDVPEPPKAPEYDFHRMIGSYADMGLLMRGLGLVLDFAVEDGREIDQRIAAGGGTGVGQIQLKPDLDQAGTHVTPSTAFMADNERFVTRPAGNDSRRGLLRLERSDDGWQAKDEGGLFDLWQLDPDGAAMKTADFTLTAQNLLGKSLSKRTSHGEVTYTTGDRQAVAALRSGGIGVSRHGRATRVAKTLAASAAKNAELEAGSGSEVTLFAEDVFRGYRVDVAPVKDIHAKGDWFSLCRREGSYALIESGDAIAKFEDEGYVSGASTTSGSPDSAQDPDDHYLHEAMFRWSGWSLVCERPGRAIVPVKGEGPGQQGEAPGTVTEAAETGNGIAASYKPVKGSLPKLRFGQLYRLRARIVDLAGNALAHDDPTLGPLEQASDAVGYWRFEPVDPPVMVHRTRVSEGESLERMVIRSNYATSPGDYVAGLPANPDFEYGEVNERHLVPPKTSQVQAEQHGFFDPFMGSWDAIKKGYEIAAKEAGSLADQTPGGTVELVTPAAQGAQAATQTLPLEAPSPEKPTGDRLAGGQYIIHREPLIDTPWLPDAAARGVALRAAPGHKLPDLGPDRDEGSLHIRTTSTGERVILIDHATGDTFAERTGIRIVLAEHRAALTEIPCAEVFPDKATPKWDEGSRVLTFFLPKGRILRLRYASFIDLALLDPAAAGLEGFGHFGIPAWITDAVARGRVIEGAAHGTNWTMTPFRPLTLVHAVQAPLCLPELENLFAQRTPGDHHARLSVRNVRLHGPSSGKFEIEARWFEWVDEPGTEKPERREFTGQLGEIKLAENHANEFILSTAVAAQMIDPTRARPDRHEFGDGRFRLIEYRARATTRFREYLPPEIYADRDKVTRLGPIAQGAAMALPDPTDAGAPILPDPAGSTAQTTVAASIPPRAPRVLYTVPTFRWTRTQAGNQHRVTRLGNGLRVWLDRPWFSSGDGELLGVMLAGANVPFGQISERMQNFATQWGADPLWASTNPASVIRPASFPARVHDEAVTLPETGQPAHVVGHRVHFDVKRKLWYCDLEIEPGQSYTPFIRLALVRYQPNALSSAKVSKVVLTDFVQVLPRRHAVVTLDGAAVTAALHGPAPVFGPMKFQFDPFHDSEFQNAVVPAGAHETGRNRVELVLQKRDPAIESDLAWEDERILVSEIVGGPSADGLNPLVANVEVRDGTLHTVATRAGGTVRLSPTVDLGRLAPGGIGRPTIPIDPAFWSGSATIPRGDGAPRRLMLREFERFYTDDTVPERPGSTLMRRVIEERLIYATTFDL